MKKVNYLIVGLIATSLLFISCSKNDDPAPVDPTDGVDFTKVEIEDFIWRGMNTYYYWKDYIPNLNDNKKDDNTTYFNILNSYSPKPDDFFDSLIYQPKNVDVYSWITDDYVAQDEGFQGIVKSNGVVYRLTYETGSSTNLLGYVRYILPNSDASTKDIKRGDVFNSIDDEQLTVSNYSKLLGRDSYTMHFADLNGGNPTSNGKTVDLTKVANFKENPIHITKSFDVNGTKIGYLMFNAFDGGWNSELNAAFGQLKANGVTELVLDLRYNRGGFNSVAMNMVSLITGQFPGQVVSKQKWNTELSAWFNANHPDWLLDTFVDKITYSDAAGNTVEEALNSLNLTNLVAITTSSTASASESVISGLSPYITVATIGTKSYGKYVGSITVYDSDNFSKTGPNLKPHTWAMQPITFEYMNSAGQNVQGGIEPTVEKIEYVADFKELGTLEEPLLAEAIAYITGSGKPAQSNKAQRIQFDEIENKLDPKYGKNGYVTDKALPADFFKRNK